MNPSVIYDEICKDIWHFYESQNSLLHNAFEQAAKLKSESRFASPWLPPPPDRCNSQVRFLFVGLSPKRLDNYRYASSLDEAKKQAGEYRYVSNGERKDTRFNYDPYYKPLWEIAKTLDNNFGRCPNLNFWRSCISSGWREIGGCRYQNVLLPTIINKSTSRFVSWIISPTSPTINTSSQNNSPASIF